MVRCYWPPSGGQVAWLCVLHVLRCDLGPGRTSGLPPVASFGVRARALGAPQVRRVFHLPIRGPLLVQGEVPEFDS